MVWVVILFEVSVLVYLGFSGLGSHTSLSISIDLA